MQIKYKHLEKVQKSLATNFDTFKKYRQNNMNKRIDSTTYVVSTLPNLACSFCRLNVLKRFAMV